jgi:hypothetical protein
VGVYLACNTNRSRDGHPASMTGDVPLTDWRQRMICQPQPATAFVLLEPVEA